MKTLPKLLLIFLLLPTLPKFGIGQNIVKNPGFEDDINVDGFPDDWSRRVYVSIENIADSIHTGSQCLKVENGPNGQLNSWTSIYDGIFIDGSTNGGFSAGHCFANIPTLDSNVTYTMSFWIKTQGTQSGDNVRLNCLFGSNQPLIWVDKIHTTWKKYEVSFTTKDDGNTTPGIQTQLFFSFQLSPNAKVWIDDVVLLKNNPAEIRIESSSNSLMADGNSFSTITAKVYDSYGNFLPAATNSVSFSLTGPGELIGSNPNVCINGQTSISYKTSTTTGNVTVYATSPGLIGDNVTINVVDYGNQGVPQLGLDYNADVEFEWWENHQFNYASSTYNPNIISPDPKINISDHGNNLQTALNALPDSGGTIILEDGQTYILPQGISISQRNNIHIVSNGTSTIKASETFSGIPRPDGKSDVLAMLQIMPNPGDWHDDNYINLLSLNNPLRNFYFKNIVFDGNNKVESSINLWTTCDVIFDNCTFFGAYGNQELHSGAWSNNVFIRNCYFKGHATHAVVLDGTHGSGILNSKFENTISGSIQVVFLSNDDCTRDVISDGANHQTWQPEEIRLGNYIVVEGCDFGYNSTNGKIPIASSCKNLLVKDNILSTGAHNFFEIGPRCTQMTHVNPMPGYDYEFWNNRLVGNVVKGSLDHFADIRGNANTNCTDASLTSDGVPNGSTTGWYQARGNVVQSCANGFIQENAENGNTIIGDNIVCGNCINDPSCIPNSYPDCITPEPSYADLGCFTNAGRTFYLSIKGDDNNDGSSPTKAWRTFDHSVDNMTPGATLLIDEGIYYTDSTRQLAIKGGVDQNNATIIKAKTGKRVIITSQDKGVPSMKLDDDFIRIEGIWFGGKWNITNGGHEFHLYGGGRIDYGREIVGCTFFGFRGIRGGGSQRTLFQNNRMVRNGVENDPPNMFFSGDVNVGYGQHDVIDNNIVIKGNGYAFVGWHSYHNSIYTRNRVFDVWGGWCGDGKNAEYQGSMEGGDHLVANNLFWNTGEGNSRADVVYNAATIISSNIHYLNNVHVDNSNIAVSWNTEYGYETLENVVIDNNAHNNVRITFGGDNSINLTEGNEEAEFGISKDSIYKITNYLDSVFAGNVEDIFNNKDIQTYFDALNFEVPETSPLKNSGKSWDPKQPTMNVGPDIEPVATCADDWWHIYSPLGLRQWNQDGNMFFNDSAFTFSDASGSGNYREYKDDSELFGFKAIIAPKNAKCITLKFLEFDTELNGDFVNIYNKSVKAENLLGSFSGSILPDSIYFETDSLILDFVSNNNGISAQGWKVSYYTGNCIISDTSTTDTLNTNDSLSVDPSDSLNVDPTDSLNIDPNDSLDTGDTLSFNTYCSVGDFCVSPNPASHEITIEEKNGNNDPERYIVIYNFSGQQVYSGSFINPTKTIDISSLQNGFYIVSVVGKNYAYATKIVKN